MQSRAAGRAAGPLDRPRAPPVSRVIRLALRVRDVDAEFVLADLLELAPGGVEEIGLPASGEGGGLVEYAVYGAPGELPTLPDVRAVVGGALVEVSTSEIPDDWSERWKQFHRPVLIRTPATSQAPPTSQARPTSQAPPTSRTPATSQAPAEVPHTRVGHCIFVRPPWEPPNDRDDALEIVIDPAQAFGTGAHATTRLCLELLLAIAAADPARGAVLDLGCGSGVLAIAARKLGYGPVLALDNDRESVLATEANARVNGVDILARRFDLRGEVLPLLDWGGDGDGVPLTIGAPATSGPGGNDGDGVPSTIDASATTGVVRDDSGGTVVLANLLRPLLLELADRMPLAPLHLVASGLLREQADEVADAFARRFGLSERARRERGEWAALWLTATAAPL